jgi:hypothetical protein
MLKSGWILALVVGLLPAAVSAQDNEPTLPALAGTYTYVQSTDGQALQETLTIEGTGPLYTLTLSGGLGDPAPMRALAQGNVLVAVDPGQDCAPAALLRQSDGSLFGVWIDPTTPRPALGLEHYVPQKLLKTFAGRYDFVGSYGNGTQYTGTTTITLKRNGSYDIRYEFQTDEYNPDLTPEELGTLEGVGLAEGPVLGFSFSNSNNEACSAFVATFSSDGSYEGQYMTDSGLTGDVSGQRRAS